jgi:hypothetical protein
MQNSNEVIGSVLESFHLARFVQGFREVEAN